ncbi:hypothetical protein [Cobetia sp. 5-11-6-3]|uniref:hypothetical protein n=1 Tax=Cobetia sp. 5-11-6-3 TaxID=2737458 RepID=UPI0015965DCA|nr:hypothetical protein [Cobetia sp. 5-11-6-3]
MKNTTFLQEHKRAVAVQHDVVDNEQPDRHHVRGCTTRNKSTIKTQIKKRSTQGNKP